MVVICATLMGAPPAEAAVAPDVPLDEPLDEEAHAETPTASATVAAKARERRMARLLNLDIMNLRFCAVPQMLSYLRDFVNVSWTMSVWYWTGVIRRVSTVRKRRPGPRNRTARGVCQLRASGSRPSCRPRPRRRPPRGAGPCRPGGR